MTEATRKKVIAGVLVVAVIWGYQNLAPKDSNPPAERAPAAAQVQAQTQIKPTVKPAVVPKLVNVEDKSKEPWGSDPFRTVKTAVRARQNKQPAGWLVSGILYNDRTPVAIINKTPVKVGEMIDGAKVVKIRKKTVTLQYNGTNMTITVTKG